MYHGSSRYRRATVILESDHIWILGKMVEATRLKQACCCLISVQRVPGFDCLPRWGSFVIIPICINFEKDSSQLYPITIICVHQIHLKSINTRRMVAAWQRLKCSNSQVQRAALGALYCILVQSTQLWCIIAVQPCALWWIRFCAVWSSEVHGGSMFSILVQFIAFWCTVVNYGVLLCGAVPDHGAIWLIGCILVCCCVWWCGGPVMSCGRADQWICQTSFNHS